MNFRFKLVLAGVLTLFCCQSFSEEKGIEQVEIYESPKVIKKVPPSYPRQGLLKGQGAWVALSFMVGVDGSTFEPIVTDSSGFDYFEKEALLALKSYEYKPAMKNGVPVEASSSIRIFFEIEGEQGVYQRFHRLYKKFNKAMNSGDKDKVLILLSKMDEKEAQNNFEDAYLNIAHYRYEEKYGSKEEQLRYLNKADFSHVAQYLPADIVQVVQLKLFELKVALKDYAGALKTFSNIQSIANNGTLGQAYIQTVEEIQKLAKDDSSYWVEGKIDKSGFWNYDLLRSGFSFKSVVGRIQKLKLRCTKKYIYFEYLSNKDYHLPDSYGKCSVEVVGDPETSFELIQFKGIASQSQNNDSNKVKNVTH